MLSICAVQAGNINAPNVIPESLTLSRTVRTFDAGVRAMIEAEMRRMTEHIALAQGLGREIRVDNLTPPLINSAVPARHATAVAKKHFGAECPVDVPLSIAGEDFAEYVNRIPSIQMYNGMADDAHNAMLHNPKFDFNDAVLPEAVWFLCEIARTRLEELAC